MTKYMKLGGGQKSGGGGKMVSDKIRRYNQIRRRNGEKALKEVSNNFFP